MYNYKMPTMEEVDKLLEMFYTYPDFANDLKFKIETLGIENASLAERYVYERMLPLMGERKENIPKVEVEKDLGIIKYDFSTDEGIKKAALCMAISMTIGRHFPHKYKQNLVPFEKQEEVLDEIIYSNPKSFLKRIDYFEELIRGYEQNAPGLDLLSKKFQCNIVFDNGYEDMIIKLNNKNKR